MSEKEFMAQVRQLAHLCGWRTYHTHDSRRSDAGFLDLVLLHVRRRVLLFVELKTDTGRVRPEQAEWIADLKASGVPAYVWRPRDWEFIEMTLKGE